MASEKFPENPLKKFPDIIVGLIGCCNSAAGIGMKNLQKKFEKSLEGKKKCVSLQSLSERGYGSGERENGKGDTREDH